MKITITVLMSLFMSFNLFAQSEPNSELPSKNQINIGYFNVLNFAAGNDLGLGYKRTFKNSALRIASSISHSKSDDKRDDSSDDISVYKSNSVNIKPRIGYEFHKNFNRIQIFYGFDITGKIHKQNYSREESYNQDYNYSEVSKTYGAGLSPFFGLKIQISKMFSISTETNFDITYEETNTKYVYNDNERSKKTNSTGVKLNPLGIISLNIHF